MIPAAKYLQLLDMADDDAHYLVSNKISAIVSNTRASGSTEQLQTMNGVQLQKTGNKETNATRANTVSQRTPTSAIKDVSRITQKETISEVASNVKTSPTAIRTSKPAVQSSATDLKTSTSAVKISENAVKSNETAGKTSTHAVKTSTPAVKTSTPAVNTSETDVKTSTPVVKPITSDVKISTTEVKTSLIASQNVNESLNNIPKHVVSQDVPVLEIQTAKVVPTLKKALPMVRGPVPLQTYCEIPAPYTYVNITKVIDARTIFIRPIDLESQKEYSENVEAIARYAETAEPLQEAPVVGQIVLAKDNEEYHRAMVLKIVSDRMAVAYIEYGHIGLVTVADCKELSGDLQILKRYVHKCILNIRPEIIGTNKEALKLLNSMVGVDMEIIYNPPFTNNTLVNLCQIQNGHSLKELINAIIE